MGHYVVRMLWRVGGGGGRGEEGGVCRSNGVGSVVKGGGRVLGRYCSVFVVFDKVRFWSLDNRFTKIHFGWIAVSHFWSIVIQRRVNQILILYQDNTVCRSNSVGSLWVGGGGVGKIL